MVRPLFGEPSEPVKKSPPEPKAAEPELPECPAELLAAEWRDIEYTEEDAEDDYIPPVDDFIIERLNSVTPENAETREREIAAAEARIAEREARLRAQHEHECTVVRDS